jgi:predicted GNAT superfamily acetyltransferase
MADCKLITIKLNVLIDANIHVLQETLLERNHYIVVSDHPAFEKALNTYLKQGYRITEMIHHERDAYSFLLVRD